LDALAVCCCIFAFHSREGQHGGKVVIYSYVEWTGGARSFRGQPPVIHGWSPYVISHKRHHTQQCEYTICWKDVGDNYVYSSYEVAFSDATSDQGVLTKYTLPVSEREKALKQLQRMNVTAFSLFGSEESLMETLAFKKSRTNGINTEREGDWRSSQFSFSHMKWCQAGAKTP
jgi:hypothetical protein